MPAPGVTLAVRPADSLLLSLPVWLVCRHAGLTVSLEVASSPAAATVSAREHLPPSCRVGDLQADQLMAILETIHEQWPRAGIWPDDAGQRALARDACAGMTAAICAASPFLLHLPSALLCTDPPLRAQVRAALHAERNGLDGATITVSALAVVTRLSGLRGLLDREDVRRVQAVMDCSHARCWSAHPEVARRPACTLQARRGSALIRSGERG